MLVAGQGIHVVTVGEGDTVFTVLAMAAAATIASTCQVVYSMI